MKRCSILAMKTTILYPDIQEDANTRDEMFRLTYEYDNTVPRYPGEADTREEIFCLTYEYGNTVPRYPGGCKYP